MNTVILVVAYCCLSCAIGEAPDYSGSGEEENITITNYYEVGPHYETYHAAPISFHSAVQAFIPIISSSLVPIWYENPAVFDPASTSTIDPPPTMNSNSNQHNPNVRLRQLLPPENIAIPMINTHTAERSAGASVIPPAQQVTGNAAEIESLEGNTEGSGLGFNPSQVPYRTSLAGRNTPATQAISSAQPTRSLTALHRSAGLTSNRTLSGTNNMSLVDNASPTLTHQRKLGYRLCGYPMICDQAACWRLNISSDPLTRCGKPGGVPAFGIFVVILALTIVIGNSLLPAVVWQNRDMRTQNNMMKVSLAFSDMIIGLLLLLSALPNMVWTMSATEQTLVENDTVSKNSPAAVIAGSMLTLSVQASLLHLAYMSMERFIAIKWQLWHRGRRTRTINLQITAIWIISVISSCIPAAFREDYSYRYIPVSFLYIMAVENPTAGTAYLIVAFVTPIILTLLFTIATGLVVWRKMKTTAHMKRHSYRDGSSPKKSTNKSAESSYNNRGQRGQRTSESGRNRLKPEIAVFKTTSLMVLAFCCTLAPFITVVSLYNTGYYTCYNYAVPYAASFYACISNSFANVVIYTMRDKKFRNGVRTLFGCSRRRPWSSWATNKNATDRTNASSADSRKPSEALAGS